MQCDNDSGERSTESKAGMLTRRSASLEAPLQLYTCDDCGQEKETVRTVYSRWEPIADLCFECRNPVKFYIYDDPPNDY